jgi:regulatory protein
MPKKRNKITPEKALLRAKQTCSKQEKCISDIKRNLVKWQIPENDSEKILQNLVNERFIDESRYAHAFVKDKFALNGWGKLKIRYMLKAKEIPDHIIQVALDEISEQDYLGTLKKNMIKKQHEIKNEPFLKQKSKLLRYASSKGYETELIYRVLDYVIVA